MRRVLRIHTAFEPTRSSEQQLQLAYERVVETVGRTLTRDSEGTGEDRESSSCMVSISGQGAKHE